MDGHYQKKKYLLEIKREYSLDLYKELKQLEPFTLASHHDADGVYSASILMDIFEVEEVEFPPFYEYSNNVALDLGYPKKEGWSGVIVDHHILDYPKEVLENPKIKCFLGEDPTGLLLYKFLGDKIPGDKLWKIVGALTGDGQPEKTPDEIWEKFPILLEERGYLAKGDYKEFTTAFPLFYFLSSGINAICRLGFPHQALDIVNNAEGPLEILDNIEVKDAIERVRKEEEQIYKNKPLVETIKNRYKIILIRPSNETVDIISLIATKISSREPGKTFIVINELTGKGSIRGVLAKYVANKLVKAGYQAGGHYGYCGISAKPEDIPQILKILRSL